MTVSDRIRGDWVLGDAHAPYRSSHEHLADLLTRHEWLLKRRIACGPKRNPSNAPPSDWTPDENAVPLDQALCELELQIEARVEQSRLRGVNLPLVELAERFSLAPCEIDLLFPCLAVELDSRYERVYGFLHDDVNRRLASPGLALGLYCDTLAEQLSLRAMLSPTAPLRHYRILEIFDDSPAVPLLSRSMRIDERILDFLTSDATIDSRVARYVVPLDVDTRGQDADEALLDRVVQWINASQANSKVLVYLQSAHAPGADELVSVASTRSGLAVMTIDMQLLLDPGTDFEQILFLLFREALLRQTAIYLRNIDKTLEQAGWPTRHRTFLCCLAELGSIVFASGEPEWRWQLPHRGVMLRAAKV